MAQYDSTIATGLILRIVTTPSAGNVAGNYTPVNVKLYLVTTNGRVVSNATKNGTITIDGTNYYFSTSIGTLNNNSSKLLGEANKNVPHNPDGHKTLNVSVSFGLNITYAGSWIGTVSNSIGEILTPIARASTPTATGTFQLGNSITINTNRASTSFTHTLRYGWGSMTGTIATGLTNNTTWTIPKSLATGIPNGTSGTLRIYCDTYNGSTLIGTKYTDYTVTTPDTDEFKPSVTGCTLTEAVSGINAQFGAFVQSRSKISGSASAKGAYGSTIKSWSVSINGATYTSNTFTTDVLIGSGSQNCVVTVTDSRNRSKSATYKYNVDEYSTPTVQAFNVERCDIDGTLNDEGSNAKVTVNASISPINNKNTKSFNLLYKKQNETNWTDIALDNASYSLSATQIIQNIDGDYEYDFKIEATDYFTSTSKDLPLSSAFTLINYNASGRGIAFGKVSSKDAFEFGMDAYDKFGTKISNGITSEDENLDPNQTLEELIITNHLNNPSGNDKKLYIIHTLFIKTRALDSNRFQIAYPYESGTIHTRIFKDGVWSNWIKYAKSE